MLYICFIFLYKTLLYRANGSRFQARLKLYAFIESVVGPVVRPWNYIIPLKKDLFLFNLSVSIIELLINSQITSTLGDIYIRPFR